jgi:hypothetical protein
MMTTHPANDANPPTLRTTPARAMTPGALAGRARHGAALAAFLAALALPPIQHSADASPPAIGTKVPVSKYDVAHSEQGNFGLVTGGPVGSIERSFGSGQGEGGGGVSLSGGDCPADWDGDGVITSSDVVYYFNDYVNDLNRGTTLADFNTDSVTNSVDAVEFINAWFMGCN